MPDRRALVGVDRVDLAGLADRHDRPRVAAPVQAVRRDGDALLRARPAAEAAEVAHPARPPRIPHHALPTGEVPVPSDLADRADGVAPVAPPFRERIVLGERDADLLLPGPARAGLAVVVEPVGTVARHDPHAVEPRPVPRRRIGPLLEDRLVEAVPREKLLVRRPREAIRRAARFIPLSWIGVVHEPVLPVLLDELARTVEVVFLEKAGNRPSVHVPAVLRLSAREDDAVLRPVEHVRRGCKRGLVAHAVEADVHHVDAAPVAEETGVVHREAVERPRLARGREDRPPELVRREIVFHLGLVRDRFGRRGHVHRHDGGQRQEQTLQLHLAGPF